MAEEIDVPIDQETEGRVVRSPVVHLRIMPPPPRRSQIAADSQAGITFRDIPAVAPLEATHRAREVACSSAHAEAMRVFLESDALYAVVLEDDAILSPDRRWMELKGYDLFIPFAHNREPRPVDATIVERVLPVYGSFAYLCSRRFALRYRERLLRKEISDHALPRAAQGLRFGSFAGNIVMHDNQCLSLVKGQHPFSKCST